VRLGIVGSRSWENRKLFWKIVKPFLAEHGKDLHIVSGGAPDGADHFAELYARQKGLRITIHHADWDGLGKGAGFARNGDIVNDSQVILCFWDGKSKGSMDTVRKALARMRETEELESTWIITEDPESEMGYDCVSAYDAAVKPRVANIYHRKDAKGVYIGRAGKGRDGYFGNPFQLGDGDKGSTLERFERYARTRIKEDPEYRARVKALRGRRLLCFCAPKPCHGDVLAKLCWELNGSL